MAKALPVPGLRARAPFRQNARKIVAIRVAEMFHFAHAVGDVTKDEDLHNMRIAAKRLRYTLEMFRVLLDSDGPAVIDSVKEVQERIGVIHDADVLSEIVRLRLAVVAHRQIEALAGTAQAGSEDERVAAVRTTLDGSADPRRGLALLLARTHAGRDRDFAALTTWWAEHGGASLRARLEGCIASLSA